MPEYQKIRKKYSSFLEFCSVTSDVIEVTLQPLERFDLDAAIIFSDILVIPQAIGYKVEFIEATGPKITGRLSKKSLDLKEQLSSTYEAIKEVRKKLPKEKALIGFAGAPWTLACYIFSAEKNFQNVKRLAYEQNEEFQEVFDVLVEQVYQHLANQIKSGADAVKIFDSWASVLDQNHITQLSFKPLEYICKRLKKNFPNTPIIIFSKGCASQNLPFTPDCLAVSYNEDLGYINSKTPKSVVIQGNLDPTLLEIDNKELIKAEVERILSITRERKHVFNLGHGVNPQAKIENINYVIECIRGFK